MKKFVCVFSMLLAAICLTGTGTASAADGMNLFREVYMTPIQSERNYVVELMFNGPTFHSDAKTYWTLRTDGTAEMAGKFAWDFTNLNTNKTTQHEIPIYGERNGSVFNLYGKSNIQWEQETILLGITDMLDALHSNKMQQKQKFASTVRSVDIRDVGANNTMMQIQVDGKALAVLENEALKAGIDSIPAVERDEVRNTAKYTMAALNKTDINLIWTVNRQTHETVTVAVDLTDFIRNYARAVLDDSYKGNITLTQSEKDLLASIGYYYDLQCYISYDSKKDKSVALPNDLNKNITTTELFEYIEKEIVDVVK